MRMIKMYVQIASVAVAAFASETLSAAKGHVASVTAVGQTEDVEGKTSPDYRLETVDGVTWQYFVSNGMAIVEAPYKDDGDSRRKSRASAIDNKMTGAVKVPEKLGGVAVGRIGENAFVCCSNLVAVVIPDGVESIGTAAFYACKALKSITIPSSVKSVGFKAFVSCWNLKTVVFMPGVESIGTQAFITCPRLSCVRFPSSIRKVGRTKGGEFGAFDVWGRYAYGPAVPLRTSEDGALTFVVDKGDEDRVREMFCSRAYEMRRKHARERGLVCPVIQVVPEDEYRQRKD